MKATISRQDSIKILMNGIAQKWKRDSLSNSIFKNMTILASGSAAKMAIAILLTPIITRIYIPEHMGVLAVFTSLTGMMMPFATLRYSMAIPLPQHNGAAMNLVILCGSILIIFSIVVGLLFWIFAEDILSLISMEKLFPYWWLLPISVLFTGLYEILINWGIREKAFKSIAQTKAWQTIVGSVVKIVMGLFGIKPLGLLIGQIFNQAGGLLRLLTLFLEKFKLTWKHVTFRRIFFLSKYYSDFPVYRLPSQFLLVFSAKSLLLFFAWQYGAETTGQLGLALMIIAIPMTLFGQTTGQAYYAEIAKIGIKKSTEISEATKNITKKLFIVGILPFLTLFFFGQGLFQIVFGDSWHQAGLFASILAFYLLAQFIASPITNVLNVIGKQAVFFKLNSIRTIGMIAILYISFLIGFKAHETVFFYSISLSLYYVLVSLTVFKLIRLNTVDKI